MSMAGEVCPVNFKCPSGSAVALPCATGSYQPLQGSSECLDCASASPATAAVFKDDCQAPQSSTTTIIIVVSVLLVAGVLGYCLRRYCQARAPTTGHVSQQEMSQPFVVSSQSSSDYRAPKL